MKKLFFLDLINHIKTGSAVFIQDILKRRFNVHLHYASGRRAPDMCTASDVAGFDALLYFQMSPTVHMAKGFNKPSIYVPMYDGESFNPWKWRRIAQTGARVISFSSVLTARLAAYGLNILTVRYFPPKADFSPGNPRKMFLWHRGCVSFEALKKCIRPDDFDEIIIRLSESSREKFKCEEIERYHVRLIPADYLKTREEYYALFKECGVYVAPRYKEGIGMSFLEAMSMGKCVLVHNDATMNEYVQNGCNGYVVNMLDESIEPLDWTEAKVRSMQQKAFNDCQIGFQRWKDDQGQILEFISDTIDTYRKMRIGNCLKWWMMAPLQFVVNVKNYLHLLARRILK